MLEGGYIKLYRSLLSWEWYDDPNTLRVFLHLLLTVNHEPQQWRGITIERGQRVSSLSKLGQELGLSAKEMRTALRHLSETGEVAHCPTAKYGVFTVNNYDKFQVRAPSEAVCLTQEGQSEGGQPGRESGTQRATKEEGKENKKKEKIPPISPKDIFEEYTGEDEELLQALRDYEQMRQKIKSPMTGKAKALLLEKLDKLAEGHGDRGRYKRECLEQSILKSWKSVYPLKQEEKKSAAPDYGRGWDDTELLLGTGGRDGSV